jgi:hypothetical protein
MKSISYKAPDYIHFLQPLLTSTFLGQNMDLRSVVYYKTFQESFSPIKTKSTFVVFNVGIIIIITIMF